MSRGVVPLSGDGFNAIFLVGIAAAFGVEAVLGKYGRGSRSESRADEKK